MAEIGGEGIRIPKKKELKLLIPLGTLIQADVSVGMKMQVSLQLRFHKESRQGWKIQKVFGG